MRETGFEPAQALSYRILSPARLTTPTLPLKHQKYNSAYKTFSRKIINLIKKSFKQFRNRKSFLRPVNCFCKKRTHINNF